MPVLLGDTVLQSAPQKVITFDGSAGNGAVGAVKIWGFTGQVIVLYVMTFVTVSLVSAGAATLALSPFHSTADAYTLLTANKWWNKGVGVAGVLQVPTTDWFQQYDDSVNSQINMLVGTAAITAGTIECDAIYLRDTPDSSMT